MIVTTLIAMRSTLEVFADASAKFYQIKKIAWCSEKIATLKMELESKFPIAKDWMFTVACAPVVTAAGAARRLRDVTQRESTEDTESSMALVEHDKAAAGASTSDNDDIPIHDNPRVKRRRQDTPRPPSGFRQRLRIMFGGATVIPMEDTDDLAFASQQPEDDQPPTPPTLQLPTTTTMQHADDLAAAEVANTLHCDDTNAAPGTSPRDSDALAPGHSPHPRRRRLKSGKVKFQRRNRSPEPAAPPNTPAEATDEHAPLNKFWDKILRAKLARLSKAALDIQSITNGVPVPPDRH